MQFGNGGSAGSVYGYIFIWLGTLSVFATMGELSSMSVALRSSKEAWISWLTIFSRSPTAGGQYHWVSQLAPPSMQKFLSYLIGMFTFVEMSGRDGTHFILCEILAPEREPLDFI